MKMKKMNLEQIIKPKYYSFREVWLFMEISPATLYRAVKCGKIKAVNIAKSGTKPIYGFRAEDVQEYYDSLPNTNQRLEEVHK